MNDDDWDAMDEQDWVRVKVDGRSHIWFGMGYGQAQSWTESVIVENTAKEIAERMNEAYPFTEEF